MCHRLSTTQNNNTPWLLAIIQDCLALFLFHKRCEVLVTAAFISRIAEQRQKEVTAFPQTRRRLELFIRFIHTSTHHQENDNGHYKYYASSHCFYYYYYYYYYQA